MKASRATAEAEPEPRGAVARGDHRDRRGHPHRLLAPGAGVAVPALGVRDLGTLASPNLVDGPLVVAYRSLFRSMLTVFRARRLLRAVRAVRLAHGIPAELKQLLDGHTGGWKGELLR